jgi:hypothetical protein
VPVVVLHLYRRRRRRVVVAFLPLLREGIGSTRRIGGLRRLSDAAALLARLLALAAIVLALAGPRPAREGPPPTDLVLVVDADATTAAREARGTTRFERGVRLARAHAAAQDGGRLAVVVAGAVPRAVVPLTADRAAVDVALADLSRSGPDRGRADLAAALRVARGVASSSPGARVLALTSRPLPGDPADGPSVLVDAAGIGEATDDQGIVEASIVPSADGTKAIARFAVRNFGSEARTRRLSLAWKGSPPPALSERDLDLPAHGTSSVSVEVDAPGEGRLLLATLLPPAGAKDGDVLASNDVAAAWVEAAKRPSVLVVHAGAPRPFVRAFLDAMGTAIDAERSGTVLLADAKDAPARDVSIYDGVAPTGRLAPGAYVFLAPFTPSTASGTASATPFVAGREVRDPLVWRTEASHPLLRGVDLSTAIVARGTSIRGEGVRGLAFAESEPVVAEGEAGGVRFVVLGLHPEGSDLPIRAALPILLRNAVRRLHASRAAPFLPFHRAREPLVPRAPLPQGEAARVTMEAVVPGSGAPPEPFRVDAGAREEMRGSRVARVPDGGPWLATVSTGAAPGAAFRTAFVDLDPERDVSPARPIGASPPPAPDREAVGDRWRRALLGLAAVFLLLDLIASRLGSRARAGAGSRGPAAPRELARAGVGA